MNAKTKAALRNKLAITSQPPETPLGGNSTYKEILPKIKLISDISTIFFINDARRLLSFILKTTTGTINIAFPIKSPGIQKLVI